MVDLTSASDITKDPSIHQLMVGANAAESMSKRQVPLDQRLLVAALTPPMQAVATVV